MKLFYSFHDFFQVESLEQDFQFFYHMSATKLCQDLFSCFRHERFKQFCTFGNALDQIPQNCFQTILLVFFFCQCPRHGLIDIFVAAFEQIEDFCDCICHTQLFHFCFYCLWCIFCYSFQICIYFFCNTFICHSSAKVFICHRNSTVYKVSKCIGKIGIQSFYHQLPGDYAIIFKRHFMQHEVTDRIYAKEIYEFICIEYISF